MNKSIEPATLQDAEFMQEAMENLELNPPAEFFEDAALGAPWDRIQAPPLIHPPQQSQRVSAMKFSAAGYPPLVNHHDGSIPSPQPRQGSEMDMWRYKSSPSVQDIALIQQ